MTRIPRQQDGVAALACAIVLALAVLIGHFLSKPMVHLVGRARQTSFIVPGLELVIREDKSVTLRVRDAHGALVAARLRVPRLIRLRLQPERPNSSSLIKILNSSAPCASAWKKNRSSGGLPAAGRLYGAFEVLGYPEGFDFHAESGGAIHEMGAELTAQDVTLSLTAPRVRDLNPEGESPEIITRILRATAEGWTLESEGGNETLTYAVSTAGAYRGACPVEPQALTHIARALTADRRQFVSRWSSSALNPGHRHGSGSPAPCSVSVRSSQFHARTWSRTRWTRWRVGAGGSGSRPCGARGTASGSP